MNTKNNRKAKLSKEKIQNALLDIIKNKEYQISIKYLCEVAKINRTTFYSHYDSIEDILYEMCGGYITKACDIFLDKTISYQERIKQSLMFLYQNGDFFYYTFNKLHNIEYCIMQMLDNELKIDGASDDKKTKLSLSFVVSGFVGIGKLYFTNFWESKTNKFTLDEVADILANTINQENKYFLIK